jgi:hypothetical protein
MLAVLGGSNAFPVNEIVFEVCDIGEHPMVRMTFGRIGRSLRLSTEHPNPCRL